MEFKVVCYYHLRCVHDLYALKHCTSIISVVLNTSQWLALIHWNLLSIVTAISENRVPQTH